MSTLEVNAIKSRTGTDITIDSTAAITGTASQFKITGGTAGQALITDGAGNITFVLLMPYLVNQLMQVNF